MDLCLLKLGGSLITDKNSPHTARPDVLARLAAEIHSALVQRPDLGLVIGHGSGSFGHVAAKKQDTRSGVSTPAAWQGFVEVWREARALNQIVIDAMSFAGLPVIAIPPSAAVLAREGQVASWDLRPLQAALAAGLIPVVNGDVIFDEVLGGTILSTEELFLHLARHLQPRRILLAGIEPGVWADYPICTRLVDRISPANFIQVAHLLRGSSAVDVTGGMLSKVRTMLELVEAQPGLEARIFSGLRSGAVAGALLGEPIGTRLASNSLG